MKRWGILMLTATLLISGCLSGCGDGASPSSGDGARLIEPVYPTDDVVIADVIATDEAFGADPTGEKDSTPAIQKALYACQDNGGTVWLPAGKYRITGKLFVPAFVTLRGDWQDPDEGKDYGTILLMDVPSEESDNGTIVIGGSSGVMGLTFYYPNQSLAAVKPYPFTVYVLGGAGSAGYMLQTVQNCTFLNSYKAVGACVEDKQNPHEMFTMENVKGTALKVAAEMYNQADVGTMHNVEFSPRIWANAADWTNPPKEADLAAYTRKNATGFLFGDLEWAQFTNITLSHFNYGIQTVKGTRCDFSAAMYNMSVTECGTAFQADAMLGQWGTVIANSTFAGDYAMSHRARGSDIRVANVTFEGKTRGSEVKKYTAAEDLMKDLPVRVAPKPKATLLTVKMDNTGASDVSADLQKALDEMGRNGGGIVYVPGGLYRLEKPVTVPAGVELRGNASVATRDQYGNSAGTLFIVYPKTVSEAEQLTETAMITLAGDKAGLRGIRFMFPENITTLAKGNHAQIKPSGYVVRGQAKDLYIVNCAFEGAYNAVDFRGCDNYYIKKVVTAVIGNGFYLGGKGGVVEGCLQNSNAMCRMGLPSEIVSAVSEKMIWKYVFDPLTRVTTEYIRVAEGADVSVFNAFAYGVKNVIVNEGGTVWVANLGGDTLGPNKPLLRVEAGDTTVINMMRSDGISYECASAAKLRIINRISHVQIASETISEFKNVK